MNPRELADPELIEPLDGLMEATGGGFDLTDIPATRAMLAAMIAAVKEQVPTIDGVTAEDALAPGLDGAQGVPVRTYRPAGATGTLPALVWLHGGGFVLGDLELDDLMLRQLSKDTGCVVVNVEYRLAPEHPFPAALEDAYATLCWVDRDAKALGVDAGRIAIAGASAGGGLAAGASLMARDRGEIGLAYQMLIYPAIDDSNVAQAGPGVPESLLWTRANALHGWTAYVGQPGSPDVPAYAAPIRADDLAGLPPTYLAVGAVDSFVDENLAYGRRLAAAGVPLELHVYPGGYHAFDVFAPMSSLAGRFVADRNAAIRRALGT